MYGALFCHLCSYRFTSGPMCAVRHHKNLHSKSLDSCEVVGIPMMNFNKMKLNKSSTAVVQEIDHLQLIYGLCCATDAVSMYTHACSWWWLPGTQRGLSTPWGSLNDLPSLSFPEKNHAGAVEVFLLSIVRVSLKPLRPLLNHQRAGWRHTRRFHRHHHAPLYGGAGESLFVVINRCHQPFFSQHDRRVHVLL